MKIVYSSRKICIPFFSLILRLVLFYTISFAVLHKILTPALKNSSSSKSKTYLKTRLCLLYSSSLTICFFVKISSLSLSSPDNIKRVTLSINTLNDLGPFSPGKMERVLSSSPICISSKEHYALSRFIIWYLTLLAKKMSPTPALTLMG